MYLPLTWCKGGWGSRRTLSDPSPRGSPPPVSLGPGCCRASRAVVVGRWRGRGRGGLARGGWRLEEGGEVHDGLVREGHAADVLDTAEGDDLAEGKPTLPLIYAIQNSTETEAKTIIDAIKNGDRDAFNEVYAIVQRTKAIDYTEQRADQEAQKAISALSVLPDSEYKQALTSLALFSVQRNY